MLGLFYATDLMCILVGEGAQFGWKRSDEIAMKTKARTKTTSPASRAEEARRLVEAAGKQPGVAELCKVYEAWQRFSQVSEAHNRLMATKQIVSTSSSSGPLLLQPA